MIINAGKRSTSSGFALLFTLVLLSSAFGLVCLCWKSASIFSLIGCARYKAFVQESLLNELEEVVVDEVGSFQGDKTIIFKNYLDTEYSASLDIRKINGSLKIVSVLTLQGKEVRKREQEVLIAA